jgi:hypothetical protein
VIKLELCDSLRNASRDISGERWKAEVVTAGKYQAQQC